MKTKSAVVLASIAASLALGGIGAANAADMAVKAPPPVLMVPGWQGFYIGINGGGGWSDTTFRGIPITGDHFLLPINSVSTGNSNDGNFVAGGQVGYNWQWQRFVLGIEGAWSGANVRNSTGIIPDPVFPAEAIRLQSKIEQYGSIAGRAGFAPTNDWLLYVRGGWATARVSTNPQDFFPLPATLQHFSSGAAWHSGGTVGAGVEYKFARNWVVGLEYDYYDFGTQRHSNPTIATVGPAVGAPTFYSQDVSTRMSTITGRISYLFNAGPVVAKY